MDVPTQPLAATTTLSTQHRAWLRVLPLAVVVLVALGLRLYQLGAQSLWLDEGGTWVEVTRNSWLQLLADMGRPSAAYPLYHLLLKAWVALAGDGEWALRFPSALAGVGTVAMLMLAAGRQKNGGRWTAGGKGEARLAPITPSTIQHPPSEFIPTTIAGLLAAVSPYALWHAQDAKAYSLLMFVVALMLWAGLKVCAGVGGRESGNRSEQAATRVHPASFMLQNWLLLVCIIVASLFVHRLALLPVAALLVALGIHQTKNNRQRAILLLLALVAAVLGVLGLARSITSNGWQESGHSAASSIESMWLNLQHFILDRGDVAGFWGVPMLLWALPALLLTVWGLGLLIRDTGRGNAQASVVLSMFVVPLLLFALVLAFTPVYEARYAAVAFPAWILVLARPFQRTKNQEPRTARTLAVLGSWFLVLAVLLINTIVLLQPKHGLFSGDPVKEEWREAITRIARQLHPDDLLVLHPYYTLPLWEYYAPRVTPDPLPLPTIFPIFGQGSCVEDFRGNPQAIRTCFQRRYDSRFNELAFGKKRALLLIAPDHAATIDPPKTRADLQADYQAGILSAKDDPPTKADEFGWLGLRFLIRQNSWPCGGDTFVGIQTMCQSYPSTYDANGNGKDPVAPIKLTATFGGEITLQGYSLDLFGGKARPGGALPVTLYWQAAQQPSRNYSMFLHLCQDCDQPPLAGVDGPPLRGYPDAGLTSTWIVGDPVHDERSLSLPANLAPGRYTLILGVRPADENPNDQSLRLPVQADEPTLGTTRLILGTVEIQK